MKIGGCAVHLQHSSAESLAVCAGRNSPDEHEMRNTLKASLVADPMVDLYFLLESKTTTVNLALPDFYVGHPEKAACPGPNSSTNR